MSAVSLYTTTTTPGISWQGMNKVGVLKISVDLSKRYSPYPTAGFATADVLSIADIPAGTLVLGGTLNVTTVEGAAALVALAVTGTAITLLAATTINTLGLTVFSGASTLVTAASVVKATLSGTMSGTGVAAFDVNLLVANLY